MKARRVTVVTLLAKMDFYGIRCLRLVLFKKKKEIIEWQWWISLTLRTHIVITSHVMKEGYR